jgi:hypothetical protein
MGLTATGLGQPAAWMGRPATGLGHASRLGILATRMEPGIHAVAGGIRAIPFHGGG